MTPWAQITPTGTWTPQNDLWLAIRVRRVAAGDTIAEPIEMLDFSLRYRVER